MLLLETIRTCNRRIENIHWHNERFNKTRKELFGEAEKIDLKKIIKIPADLPRSVHKCRILFNAEIQKIEFIPYQIKKIKSIELIIDDNIEYPFKYADRSALLNLKNKSLADEIIIVKNGLLTDTSYANLVFYDGEKWLTPATPLLPGTMRAKLIAQGKIREENIKPTDLRFFKKLKLINAMLGFGNSPEIEIGKIKN
ncbi:MAG: aminotransferase class IV [Saprospiraceae bacterium]